MLLHLDRLTPLDSPLFVSSRSLFVHHHSDFTMDHKNTKKNSRSNKKRVSDGAQSVDNKNNNKRRMVPLLEPSLSLEDPRIWKTLAMSGYLDSPELGRLLLLTSNSLAREDASDGGGDDEVLWTLLCCNQWGADSANALLAATGMTPQKYFRTFAYPSKQSSSNTTLPPLQYTPKDYVMIVEVRKKSNHMLLFCRAIPGEDIPEFFVKGRFHHELAEPSRDFITLDKSFASFEEFFDSDYIPKQQPGLMEVTWEGSVHLMRRPDDRVIKLLDVSENIETLACSYAEEEWSKGILENETHSLAYESVSGCYVPPILERLGCRRRCDDYGGGMKVQLYLNYRVSLGADSEPAAIDVCGFSLYVNFADDWISSSISKALTDKQMQFAHVLEALKEWNDAPVQP